MIDTINKYCKQYGTRFSKKQKQKARAALVDDFAAAGFSGNEIKNKKGREVKNLVFGNLKSMKVAIVVPFDTPERKIWHNLCYYPLDGNASTTKMMLATFLPVIIIYAFCFFIIMFGATIFTDPRIAMNLNALMTVVLLFLVYLIGHGIANKHNATRYSASLVASLEVAKALSKNAKQHCVFIFTDKNKNKFRGSLTIAQLFNDINKNPDVIFIDSIARGSKFQLGCKSNEKRLAQELSRSTNKKEEIVKMDEQRLYQTPYGVFQKLCILAYGDLDSKNRLCVKQTCSSKDQDIQEDNISNVIALLKEYLEKYA